MSKKKNKIETNTKHTSPKKTQNTKHEIQTNTKTNERIKRE